jgi:hypothetical protein
MIAEESLEPAAAAYLFVAINNSVQDAVTLFIFNNLPIHKI